ncbi:MAG TPA: tetratricopeptide repeat protein [Flavobacterium sp.]|jgi:tetratricopeptide (TPR) repeat protein
MRINPFVLTTYISFLCSLVGTLAAQNTEGYWDRERATAKEIELCAGCTAYVGTDELPVGTTELIYRITLLDKNQQLASSLSSVLKAIPDPSGISQGSAGAITLLSTISGDDKCTFAVFSSLKNAEEYKKSASVKLACYSQDKEISKIAGRLTMQNSTCISSETKRMWFGFTNTNMLLNEKIILEVVPWVNTKASRGWNMNTKQKFISSCKNENKTNSQISDKERYCQCLLEKVQAKTTNPEFQHMPAPERKLMVSRYSEECLLETGELQNSYSRQRTAASVLVAQEKYADAIPMLQKLVDAEPTASDYNLLGYCYILTKQYAKAVKYLKLAEQLDEADLAVQSNLAHAYLFSDEFSRAKEIHLKYKNQNVTETISWKQKVASDFAAFKRASLPDDDLQRVTRLLK